MSPSEGEERLKQISILQRCSSQCDHEYGIAGRCHLRFPDRLEPPSFANQTRGRTITVAQASTRIIIPSRGLRTGLRIEGCVWRFAGGCSNRTNGQACIVHVQCQSPATSPGYVAVALTSTSTLHSVISCQASVYACPAARDMRALQYHPVQEVAKTTP
jgi:hypothetical protein